MVGKEEPQYNVRYMTEWQAEGQGGRSQRSGDPAKCKAFDAGEQGGRGQGSVCSKR